MNTPPSSPQSSASPASSTPAARKRRPRPRTAVLLAAGSLALAGLAGVNATTGTASAGTPSAAAHTSARSSSHTADDNWTTVFKDDFDGAKGSGLDTKNWLYDKGTGYDGGADHWGTGEIETSTDSTDNVYQDGDGHMVIKPIKDDKGNWTSGRIESQRTDFGAPEGGKMEMSASIKQPDPKSGLGYWPAFWAMGADGRGNGATNWPRIGEIDIMENVNALDKHSSTFHCDKWQGECHDPDGITSDLKDASGLKTDYHTYSVIVDRTDPKAEALHFTLDGKEYYTVKQDQVSPDVWKDAVDHGFFAIFDVAIGGSYPNKVCGCTSPSDDISSGAGMSVDNFEVKTTK